MKIEWYVSSAQLDQWQATTESLKLTFSMAWNTLSWGEFDGLEFGAKGKNSEADVCVVTGIEGGSEEIISALNLQAGVRLAVLGAVELEQILFARDPAASEAPRTNPPLVSGIGPLLANFDGVITVSEEQAEVLRQHLLIPVKVIRIPHLLERRCSPNQLSDSTKNDFAESFNDFLKEVWQWLPLMRLCDRVGRELAYLCADEELPVVGIVSKHVSALLPGD